MHDCICYMTCKVHVCNASGSVRNLLTLQEANFLDMTWHTKPYLKLKEIVRVLFDVLQYRVD